MFSACSSSSRFCRLAAQQQHCNDSCSRHPRQTGDRVARVPANIYLFFFFQAEDGIRDWSVTGVQTCALPIYQPGPERRVGQHLLGKLRDGDSTRIEGAGGRCDQQAAYGKVPVLEDHEADNRLFGDQQPADRTENAEERQERHQPNEVRAKPIIVFTAIHHDLQAAKANGDEGQADIVDAAPFLLPHPGRVLDQYRNQEYGDGPGRDVNEENPSPTPLVHDVATERRPQRGSDDGGNRREAERGATFCGWKCIKDDRLLVGLHAAAEEALREPEDDEFRETGGCPAEERADREHGDADQEISFAAEYIAEPARDRQHDAVGDEVGLQYPEGIIVHHPEVAGNITQCDVDDRGVENFHERRERDRGRDEPRVMARSPRRVRGGWHAISLRSSHRHRRYDRNPKRHGDVRGDTAVDNDFDWNALHDLDKIAGRILGREGGEFRPGAMLDAIDVAAHIEGRIGIDPDPDRLPRPHVGQLGFLEVGGDPDLRRDDREDLLPRYNVVALLHVPPGNPSVLRRRNDGPGQVEFGLVELRLCLLDLAFELLHLRFGLANLLRDGRILLHLRLGQLDLRF